MSKNKPRVICDTMIWYYIADGRIDPADHKHVDLVATGVNVLEMSSTENFKGNFALIKGAIKAMEDHHAEVLEYDPWSYLLEFHVSIDFDAEPIRQTFIGNLLQFQGLVDSEFDDLFSDLAKVEELMSLIKRWNQPTEDLVNGMNAGLLTTRAKGVAQHGSRAAYKKHLRSDRYSFVSIMTMIQEILAGLLKIDQNKLHAKIDWKNLELLFHVWDAFFKEVVLRPNGVFKLNDLNDILNMAYVSSDDPYWTEEKSWINLIESNPITAKYLYNPNKT